jgi:ribokinase
MVGSCNVDLIARVPRLPAPGETLIGSKFQMGFGGKGANQAVMAAKLGAQVSVVSRVGRDVFGKDTERNFRELGIDTTYLGFDDNLFSGVAPITVDENTGQNSIVIVPGANYGFFAADVRAAASAIQGADVVICQLEVLMEVTLEAFRVAKASTGKPVLTILNPAPAAELADDLLALTDIIAPNEIEAAMLTGIATDSTEGAEAAARALQGRGVKSVVLTLGSRGALYVEGNNPAVMVQAEQVQAVDTTGAGDSFVGSLAYFLGAGLPMGTAVERACAIATRSVLKTGTQTSFPNRDEVANLLA